MVVAVLLLMVVVVVAMTVAVQRRLLLAARGPLSSALRPPNQQRPNGAFGWRSSACSPHYCATWTR